MRPSCACTTSGFPSSREISLHVLNPEPVALFSAESIPDEGFRWLDSCHSRAFSGKEPTEIALTASCIENAFASHISKERENGWVQKILTDHIPFLAEAFDEVFWILGPGGNHVCIGRLSQDFLQPACSCALLVELVYHMSTRRAVTPRCGPKPTFILLTILLK